MTAWHSYRDIHNVALAHRLLVALEKNNNWKCLAPGWTRGQGPLICRFQRRKSVLFCRRLLRRIDPWCIRLFLSIRQQGCLCSVSGICGVPSLNSCFFLQVVVGTRMQWWDIFFEAVHHCFLHMDDFFHDGVQLFLAERFVNGVTQLTKALPPLVVCVQGAGSVLFTEHRVVFPLTCIISGDFGAIKNL